MAITPFQRTVCRLIAANRIEQGESYVAGGVALNLLADAPRISRAIDLFHDTEEAVDATWTMDRRLLEANRFEIRVVRERPSFVEALVTRDQEAVLMQWVRDSAYRFFPLVAHEELGLVLHPFDLATNKILAMVGRLEVRDWIDLITCHQRIQPLGYLAWAACAKDPGYNPAMILEQSGRSGHYSADEVKQLIFAGPPPDAAALSQAWHRMLAEAKELVAVLPASETGKCILDKGGTLYAGDVDQLREALSKGQVSFHTGRLRGAYPQIRD